LDKRLFGYITFSCIILLIICGCSADIRTPESDLWGEWVQGNSEDHNIDFPQALHFYEDGRLVRNGQEDRPGECTVIAPGRIKITFDGEAQVFDYQVKDGMLQFFVDEEILQFTQVSLPLGVGQSNSNSTASPSTTEAAMLTTMAITPILATETSIAVVPTATQIPTYTPALPTQAAALTLEETVVDIFSNPVDGMPLVFVPAGKFTMGSVSDQAYENEKPVHQVYEDAFWIYQYEVTNAQFREFVEQTGYVTTAEQQGTSWVFGNGTARVAGAFWAEPEGPGSDVEKRWDHPVVHTSYSDAVSYCTWAGGRLPTEAEWEKAARGTDGRTYPWGEDPVIGTRANFCDVHCTMEWANGNVNDYFEITSPVGWFPEGASFFGVMDMAGNVWEWVADFYDSGYYTESPDDNPSGPEDGDMYVIRGGSWVSDMKYITSTTRYWSGPDETSNDHGFRCVLDELPSD